MPVDHAEGEVVPPGESVASVAVPDGASFTDFAGIESELPAEPQE